MSIPQKSASPVTSQRTAARSPRARLPGRPVGKEGALREALIDAALQSFASRGYAGSTLRDIARDARATPAMANYYFGGKQGLLQAVVEQRVQALVMQMLQAIDAAGDDPVAAIAAFMRTYTSLALRNPWVPRLVVREVLSETGVLREAFAKRFAGSIAGLLGERIRQAQARGLIDPALDPAKVILSLLSLCIFPIISSPVISGVLGLRLDPDSAPDLAAHHLRVFLHGMEPRP